MGVFVILLVLGGVVAIVANSKGFDTFLWFLYGCLLFPIALAHAIVKPANKQAYGQPSNSADKKCPQCAEEIKAEALVCRFCGNREFASQPVLVNRMKHQPTTWQKLWWNPNEENRRR